LFIAVHHERKDEGLRRRSSSRYKSWVESRSGWVFGFGTGNVRGKLDVKDSIEGILEIREGILAVGRLMDGHGGLGRMPLRKAP
jgi:hypothetical protein